MKFLIALAVLSVSAPSIDFARAESLETVLVQREGGENVYVADGVVEAIRQSVIAAQVSGQITGLMVKAGDAVKTGQVLARIDERAAALQAVSSRAQATAAQAQMDAAEREYERSRRLFKKEYISQAAMDQAEAQFKATQSQAQAALAQAGVAGTQTSLHTLTAPYNGVLSEVNVEIGDMAALGRPLMTEFDPSSLRVVANLPETDAGYLKAGAQIKLEIPGAPASARMQIARAIQVLPTANAMSHTVQIRLTLSPNLSGVTPGMFARAFIPTTEAQGGRLLIPTKAAVKRTELQAVYVVDAKGQPHLRQVRLGNVMGEQTEVLAGLQAGERVALDPLVAARQ